MRKGLEYVFDKKKVLRTIGLLLTLLLLAGWAGFRASSHALTTLYWLGGPAAAIAIIHFVVEPQPD